MQGQQNMGGKRYKGEVVYLYAFDLAYDMKRGPISELLGQPVKEYLIGPSKRSPKTVFFYRPQMIRLPAEHRTGPQGPVEIEQTVKVFSVGAISIQLRVPFEVDRLEELVQYHNLKFDGVGAEDEVNVLAEGVRRELEPYCVKPVQSLGKSEEYTVFCFYGLPRGTDGNSIRAEQWLAENRREVAGLLTEEEQAATLSQQEAMESTEQYLSYYQTDLVVVDWDAALVVDEPADIDEVLHIIELANVQLAELEAYDRLLDASLQLAYQDVGRRRAHPEIHRNLREIRVDLERFNDELSNITKFFGDWHLARVYRNVSGRFHLSDWHTVVNEKLKTLGELYQLLQQDRVNYWMVILETTIVLLFILDVILVLMDLYRKKIF
jgi:hypothetical protein